jgi:acetyl esterase
MSTLRLPDAVLARLVGGKDVVVDGLTLDRATQVLLRMMELSGFGPLESLSVADARAEYATSAQVLSTRRREMNKVMDRAIDGPRGAIPVRIYVPGLEAGVQPVLVYYHGGGWVIGDLETHDAVCRQLAAEAGCIVVAVHYRRAPEHKFPAAADDCTAAFRWVAQHAEALGGDPRRIAVGGDSAGGNLAAVVCHDTRRDALRPCYQLLIYPVTDLRMRTRSYDLFATGFVLTRDLMEWFRKHYLSTDAERTDPRASPLLAEDLAGQPPALLITAGFDPLRDEGREYADRLRAAGNSVTYRCYDGLIHGFISLTGGIVLARAAAVDAARALRRTFRA